MRAANDNDTEAMDDFLGEYLDVLFPILVQGQLWDLNRDMQALVLRHGMTQAVIDANNDAMCQIISEVGIDAEEKRRQCIEALMPYCGGNAEDANNCYNYHMLQGITAERICVLVNDRISGNHTYEEEGLTGEAAVTQRVNDLSENARNLENILATYGLGRAQAQQIIRRFDAATEASIAEFTGIAQGVHPPM